ALAVAAAGGSGARRRLLRQAEQDAKRLAREVRMDALPVAQLLRAAAAFQRGDPKACLALLEAASTGFDRAEMALLAACARRRKGEILAGTEGRDLVAAADRAMTDLGVKRPERWVLVQAPGFEGVL